MSDTTPPRRRWFRRRGIDLGDLAVNSFAAFLGVFLALTVQNWHEHSDSAEKLANARAAIREEEIANRATLNDLAGYYARYSEAAAAHEPKAVTRDFGCEKVDGWHGLKTPALLHSAFDTALATGVLAKMDFAESQRLSATYAQQSFATGFLQRSLDYYVQNWLQRDLACADLFSDARHLLSALIRQYDADIAHSPEHTK